ncbi:unnamed protein product [Vicia faba]|uniref:Uncharacterized protein n=1 Tax=Vicia faba TaxID=3906 RepID=A0AAV1B874_VICFA|nr:unnamed protein product [Vicia faba]
MGSANIAELEQGFLQDERNKQYTGDGSVDFRGKPAIKHNTGNWRACPFILANECCERLAFFGIATNLVTYLTTKLHEGNASAARNVSIWQGTCYLTPLIGAVLADGYWGRYWTIAVFSMIYFLGICILTVSASVPSLKPADCLGSISLMTLIPRKEPRRLPFSTGTSLYRFQKPMGSPITRVCQVVLASVRKQNLVVPEDSSLLYEIPDKISGVERSHKLMHHDDLRYFDRAAVVSDSENRSGEYSNPWRLCTVTQVEELKILIRVFPIWATGIVFSAVYAQMSTLFVEQGTMMDTNIGSFKLSPASLSIFDMVSVVLWVPVYDRILVPIARKCTGKKRGLSVFQRIGIGHFISGLCMLSAAIVEIKRLQLARKLDLVDKPVAVPLSVLWQTPQYFLLGASEVFTFIGQFEFFYNESPDAMRTLCGRLGWIPDNLNNGHLDYFFLLLSGLGLLNLMVFIIAAKMYKQKKVS